MTGWTVEGNPDAEVANPGDVITAVILATVAEQAGDETGIVIDPELVSWEPAADYPVSIDFDWARTVGLARISTDDAGRLLAEATLGPEVRPVPLRGTLGSVGVVDHEYDGRRHLMQVAILLRPALKTP